ncbi:MAG: GAF domain-containing protein [Bdellovibrionota bacterium]
MSELQPKSKTALYKEIERSFEGILHDKEIPWETALVSLIALLKDSFETLSWVGFYRNVDRHLWVGPYQGKLACLHLKPGQGVCGRALESENSVLVEDVHQFEGHVACDPLARSELVVPVYRKLESGRTLVGVFDLDSHKAANFDAEDQKSIERLLKAIERLPDAMSYS